MAPHGIAVRQTAMITAAKLLPMKLMMIMITTQKDPNDIDKLELRVNDT